MAGTADGTRRVLLLLLGAFLLFMPGSSGCQHQRVVRMVHPPDRASALLSRRAAPRADTIIKAHLRDGGVWVMRLTGMRDSMMYGNGVLYDLNRREISRGDDSIHLSRIALFETNQVLSGSSVYAGMGIVTGISGALTLFCALNPKTCFGSCPTYYLWDGRQRRLQAEGFSASIAPALEEVDVDHLFRAAPASRMLEVEVTNEALETHVIRHTDLLAVPRPAGGRSFEKEQGGFVSTSTLHAPRRCQAERGDVVADVRLFDDIEYVSHADSTDLSTTETLDLRFDAIDADRTGLVLGFRQSLMTTYLFYQTLAYLGSSVGTFMASLEREPQKAEQYRALFDRITGGGIVVYRVDAEGRERRVGAITEVGPLAPNVHLLELPPHASSEPLHLRLRMIKGMWRIDAAMIAVIVDDVDPIRIRPRTVHRNGVDDTATLAVLLDSTRTLVTIPGDAYRIGYELPVDYTGYELFLESRGYYFEWMREEWMKEENPARVALLMLSPERFLKEETDDFKAIEPVIEEQFWSSRYVYR